MFLNYDVLLIVCLAGLATRTVYEFLKRAGRLDPKNKIIFSIVFVAMFLFLVSWPLMCPIDPWKVPVPSVAYWLGICLNIFGLGLAFGGLFQLRGLENIDHLETRGVFSITRHPMYTGFILWILGWLVMTGAVTSFFAGISAVVGILLWRQFEEEKMVLDYGEEYRRYRKTTRF